MRLKSFHLPDSGPLVGTLYLLLWLLLCLTIRPYWDLPYGLRFGALLVIPIRLWGWLLGAELLGDTAAGFAQGVSTSRWPGLWSNAVSEPLVVAAGLWLLRKFDFHANLRTPQEVMRLLLSVAIILTGTAIVDAALLDLNPLRYPPARLIEVLGQGLLSHYLAILLLVPLIIMLRRTRFKQHAVNSLLKDALLVMIPSMIVLLLLSAESEPKPQFARILSLAPVLFFAFRHGWRGASLAMFVSSAGMTLATAKFGHIPPSATEYLFLAVTGTGAILLGSATDALRRSSTSAADQNVYLGTVNKQLDQLTHQLRQAARGNLQAEENQRRHLAAELHDELGQNITAIQTHVKLAQTRFREAGMDDIGTSINSILAHMRRALHRLLDDLRPAVLDEFGLFRALEEGPIRELLVAADVTYISQLHGDPRLLDDDTLTAIYRVVQESATNAVKHAQASEFKVRLRIGERQANGLALVDVRDNGVGLPSKMPRTGRGLKGMRDRVTSLGGQFRLSSSQTGVRLRIMLRSNNALDDTNRKN